MVEVGPCLSFPFVRGRFASERSRAYPLHVFVRFFGALRRRHLFLLQGATSHIHRQGSDRLHLLVRQGVRHCLSLFYGLVNVKRRVSGRLLRALRIHLRSRALREYVR